MRGQLARISHRVAEHTVEKCLSLTSCGSLFGVFRVQTVLGVTPPGEKCGLEFSIELDPHRRARHHLRIGSR